MASKIEALKKELAELVRRGSLLYYAMADELDKLSDGSKDQLKKAKVKLPTFDTEYDTWYSESLAIVTQVIPDRVDDFVKQYKNERRKEIDYVTYGISDYLLGLVTRYGGEVVADGNAALPKLQIQISILQAAQKRFESR